MNYELLDKLLNVPSENPDIQRRSRLLNILLLGVFFLALLTLIGVLLTNQGTPAETLAIWGSIIVSVGTAVIFVLHHRGWINVASWLFLILLTIGIAFGDTPIEVLNGRTLFMFIIPILISGIILRPYNSFIMAGIISLILVLFAFSLSEPQNITSFIAFFLMAFISWLAARSLEQAVADLRISNQELAFRSTELEESNKKLRLEITERKRAEKELANQAQILSRTNAELQQFIYVSTHDLREPLRKVRAYAELLERRYKGQLDAKADKYIDFVVSGAARMQVLITDLLTYLSMGNEEFITHSVDLNQVLEKVLIDLELLVEENTAVITHDPLPEVQANPSQITHLLQNLVSNAIKFRREAPPIIHIGVQREEDEWIFSVADNGIGLDEQYTERIFIIFQRLPHQRKVSRDRHWLSNKQKNS